MSTVNAQNGEKKVNGQHNVKNHAGGRQAICQTLTQGNITLSWLCA